MPKPYIILTDSCSDLPLELIQQYELPIFPMEFTIDNKTYRNYPDGHVLSNHDFYNIMRAKKVGTTAQITPQEFIEFFTPYLEKGLDVLYVGFCSALSGTFNSSLVAKGMLEETFKDRTIACVDSLCASTGQGHFVYTALENQKRGFTIEQNVEDLEFRKHTLSIWFTVDDLGCLKRGGRLSATAAFFGTLLGIKPVLHMDEKGKLVPMVKCRGRKQSLNAMFDQCAKTIVHPEDQIVFVSSADAQADVEYLTERLKNELHVKGVIHSQVGPVIGLHSGPGTLLISYYATNR